MHTSVPFLDLGPQHKALKAELMEEISELIETGVFINGPSVEAFERAFAASCGVRDCVGTASGLDALRLGLLALGIEPGDEVAVPAMTFAATFEAVVQAGGVPVPVDVSLSGVLSRVPVGVFTLPFSRPRPKASAFPQ